MKLIRVIDGEKFLSMSGMEAIAAAMLEKAEQIYLNSKENYPETRGRRRGVVIVSVRESVESDAWWDYKVNFGETCYRNAKQLNGRDIDFGASNEGTAYGKISYGRRTGCHSGAPIGEVLDGESYWQGMIYSKDRLASFTFSGFTELDDVVVGEDGNEFYEKFYA